MAYDPVRRWQLYMRRAGNVVQRGSTETTRLDGVGEEGREALYRRGHQEIELLAARIEAQTGRTIEARTVLDFGCGVGRIALPLAERCEHVYGLDVSPAVLREADSNAKRLGLTNVEWMDAGRLGELGGKYDMVISLYVLQHIPSREGERIFATLLQGLRAGGVGALHVSLRPPMSVTGLVSSGGAEGRSAYSPLNSMRALSYMLIHSYSLNRLGRLLAAAGIVEWHVKWHARATGWRTYETATIVFRKD